jgi:hypothetical protein
MSETKTWKDIRVDVIDAFVYKITISADARDLIEDPEFQELLHWCYEQFGDEAVVQQDDNRFLFDSEESKWAYGFSVAGFENNDVDFFFKDEKDAILFRLKA